MKRTLLVILSLLFGSIANAQMRGRYMFLGPGVDHSSLFQKFALLAEQCFALDDRNVRQTSPASSLHPDSLGVFSVNHWLDDHSGAKFLDLSTHGTPQGEPEVEAWANAELAHDRLVYLTTPLPQGGGWDPSHITTGSAQLDDGTWIYGLILTRSGMSARLPALGDSALVILSWCSSWTQTDYIAKGALDEFISFCDVWDGDAARDNKWILGALGCEYWLENPGSQNNYESTAHEADRLVADLIGFNPAYERALFLRGPGMTRACRRRHCAPNQQCPPLSCSVTAARFESVRACGSRLAWRAIEEGTRGYYLLGFQWPSETPDHVEYVEAVGGGMGRSVGYARTVSQDYPIWEIVEVDDNPRTQHTHSGFFKAEGCAQSDDWTDTSIDIGHAERAQQNIDAAEPATDLYLAMVDGQAVEAVARSGVIGREPTTRTLSTQEAPPDTSLCADWFLVGKERTLLERALVRQVEYGSFPLS